MDERPNFHGLVVTITDRLADISSWLDVVAKANIAGQNVFLLFEVDMAIVAFAVFILIKFLVFFVVVVVFFFSVDVAVFFFLA